MSWMSQMYLDWLLSLKEVILLRCKPSKCGCPSLSLWKKWSVGPSLSGDGIISHVWTPHLAVIEHESAFCSFFSQTKSNSTDSSSLLRSRTTWMFSKTEFSIISVTIWTAGFSILMSRWSETQVMLFIWLANTIHHHWTTDVNLDLCGELRCCYASVVLLLIVCSAQKTDVFAVLSYPFVAVFIICKYCWNF